ncbi:hypothetical protein HDU86_003484 [Geranomyces michiganensis]|nr:hypothetical protein HDU86_003484 [Geranomyces michiganensis]
MSTDTAAGALADASSSSSACVLSMDALERHKENIKPLTSGRSAAALARLLSTQQQLSPAELERQRAGLAARLDADPSLGSYYEYLYFLQQNYPTEHPTFRDMLQAGVRHLKHDVAAKRDPRLLWMWIEVVKFAAQPVDVFKYLSVNDIATDLADYYIAYAGQMVVLERWEEAEEIFRLGINRNAQPLEKLQQKYKDFLQQPRGNSSPDAPEAEMAGAPSVGTTTNLAAVRRPALAPRAAPRSTTAAPRQSTQAQQHQPSRPAPGTNSRPKIQVYEDRTDKESGLQLAARVMPTATTANEWGDYGTAASRRKENVKEATRWTGATLPQKTTAAPSSRGSKIEVYQDEPSGSDLQVPNILHPVLREKDVSSPADVVADMDAAPKVRRPPPTQSALAAPPPAVNPSQTQQRQEPLAAPAPAHQPVQQLEQLPQPRQQPAAKSKPKARSERHCIATELMKRPGSDAILVSFEEIRAAYVRSIEPPTLAAKSSSVIAAAAAAAASTPCDRAAPATSIGFAHKARAMASPTINTKAALADVFDMFNRPLQSETALAVQEENAGDDDGGLYVDNDETISAKVYRPAAKVTIGVFEDEDSENESGLLRNGQPGTTGLQQQQQQQQTQQQPMVDSGFPRSFVFSQDENQNPFTEPSNNRTETQAPPPSRSPLQSRQATSPSAVPLAGRFDPALQSTPHHWRRMSAEGDDSGDDEANHKNDEKTQGDPAAYYNRHRGLAIMTPITEASREYDRTMALSTIGRSFGGGHLPEQSNGFQQSARHARGGHSHHDDGHTAMTMATFGDRTISSISYDGSSSHHTLENVAGDDEEDYGGAGGVATVLPAAVAIGRAATATASAAGLPRELSGVRVESDEEESQPRRDLQLGKAILQSDDDEDGFEQRGLESPQLGTASPQLRPASPQLGFESPQFGGGASPLLAAFGALSLAPTVSPPALSLDGRYPGPAAADRASAIATLAESSSPCDPYSPALILAQLNTVDFTQVPGLSVYKPSTPLGAIAVFEKAIRTANAGGGGGGGRKKLSANCRHAPVGKEASVDLPGRPCPLRLVRKLGEGGFAKVYAVADDSVGLAPRPRRRRMQHARGLRRDSSDEDGADADGEWEGVSYDHDDDDEDDDEDYKRNTDVNDEAHWALKIEASTSTSMWEHVVITTLHAKLDARVARSVIRSISCHVFPDETVQLLALGGRLGKSKESRTLLDAVNMAGEQGYAAGMANGSMTGPAGAALATGVNESLAAFWTVELLRVVEAVHMAGFVHRDIKPDNVLVRADRPSAASRSSSLSARDSWDAAYDPAGGGGWSDHGVTLIDWGAAVHVGAFPVSQKFTISPSSFSSSDAHGAKAKQQQPPNRRNQNAAAAAGSAAAADASVECWEVRTGAPWTFEPDWYGVAAIVHVLLFGRYMQVVHEPAGEDNKENAPDAATAADTATSARPRIKLATSFKRYWQTELWRGLFDVLLNPHVANSTAVKTDEGDFDDVNDGFASLAARFPAANVIRERRQALERWLAGRGGGSSGSSVLRGLLKRVSRGT